MVITNRLPHPMTVWCCIGVRLSKADAEENSSFRSIKLLYDKMLSTRVVKVKLIPNDMHCHLQNFLTLLSTPSILLMKQRPAMIYVTQNQLKNWLYYSVNQCIMWYYLANSMLYHNWSLLILQAGATNDLQAVRMLTVKSSSLQTYRSIKKFHRICGGNTRAP